MPNSFASDNSAGVHPEILAAISAANHGHALAYGADPWTARAIDVFRSHFGPTAEVFFVFNGTGANVLGIQSLVQPYEAVICADYAHINVDECGAPERLTGCKLIGVPAPAGRLTPEAVAPCLHGIGVQHHVQPRVISISQSSEYGTVYTPDEIRALADFAHANGLFLHMDGARIANAAAALDVPLRAITVDAGVDVLSFGGTKNGLLGAEAVVLFDPARAATFRFIRKQGMQLASKMRFVAAQFEALLGTDLWLESARHANAMAHRLGLGLGAIPGVTVTHPVEANGVFAILPHDAIAPLQEEMFFYVWDERRDEVRLMASFDTTPDDVDRFIAAAARVTTSLRRTPRSPPPARHC
jgi:threonine aldolase